VGVVLLLVTACTTSLNQNPILTAKSSKQRSLLVVVVHSNSRQQLLTEKINTRKMPKSGLNSISNSLGQLLILHLYSGLSRLIFICDRVGVGFKVEVQNS
jgi:hypothetical protein